MKTTFDLPDDLVRAIKLLAVHEDRKLRDLMAELLRRGLSAPDRAAPARRVRTEPSSGVCAAGSGPDHGHDDHHHYRDNDQH
mgnify:CR=1 FL=1